MDILSSVKLAYPNDLPSGMEEHYTEMLECKDIYKNEPPWGKVEKKGLYKQQSKKRDMLKINASKVLVDEFSSLTFSEQVEIKVDNESAQWYLEKALNQNGFWKNMPSFLSLAYALGGGVLKVFADNGKPCIDYVSSEDFAPTAWTGKGIFEGAFQTVTVKGEDFYTLIEKHFIEDDIPCVENKLYKSNTATDLGDEVDTTNLYSDLPSVVEYTGLKNNQMFHYFKPAVSNNLNIHIPLGLSVFYNAKGTLEALDVAFDSFMREFTLGRKRIIVPSTCIRTVIDPDTGNSSRYFDANDEVYEALKVEDPNDLKITDNTMELRIDEHVSAINALLNILCFQTGLSSGTLSFDGSNGIKTATEIISQDSKTFRTIKNNKNILAETIEGLCNSIIAIGVWYGDLPTKDYTVTIGFKDNVIVDDNTMIDNNIKLVGAGLKSKLSAIMEVLKCDEKTAQQELDRINKEQNVTGVAIDDFMGGGEDE